MFSHTKKTPKKKSRKICQSHFDKKNAKEKKWKYKWFLSKKIEISFSFSAKVELLRFWSNIPGCVAFLSQHEGTKSQEIGWGGFGLLPTWHRKYYIIVLFFSKWSRGKQPRSASPDLLPLTLIGRLTQRNTKFIARSEIQEIGFWNSSMSNLDFRPQISTTPISKHADPLGHSACALSLEILSDGVQPIKWKKYVQSNFDKKKPKKKSRKIC